MDRISDLPDEILSHILSFLPTKLAFTTTILSKRWTPLCYSLPVLNFEFGRKKFYETKQGRKDTFYRFSRFVNTLMFSHISTNKPLKTFLLNCPIRICKHSRIFNAWFEAAKQRRVQEFNLTLHFHILNPITFISHTLVVLKLMELDIGNDTSCVDLPSLKTLRLSIVYFENQNDYIGFLSACPNLENLHAEPVYYRKHGGNNTSKELKTLTLSKLVAANISAIDAFFNVIKNVKFLRIITGQAITGRDWDQVFSNLIHIDLLFSNHSIQDWDHVVELLRHSPKLQTLSVKKTKNTTSSKEWKCPTSVIECVSSHLRSCTILNFQGSANDLRFTKYILQNASHLQDMKIVIATNRRLLEQSQIIVEELSSCPRISLGCEVSFEFKHSSIIYFSNSQPFSY